MAVSVGEKLAETAFCVGYELGASLALEIGVRDVFGTYAGEREFVGKWLELAIHDLGRDRSHTMVLPLILIQKASTLFHLC